jgi:signal transduction histidine kinase
VLGLPTLFIGVRSSPTLLREVSGRSRSAPQALVEREPVEARAVHGEHHARAAHAHPRHLAALAELARRAGVYGPVADERQRRAHDEIKRSAESMLGLVDDLLALARHDAGRASFDPCDVDANDLCDRLIATTRGLIGRRTLELVSDVADRLPRLYTDRSKLTQIILNLLANAVKFTPDEGRITFRARRSESGEGVVFEVTDTGRGMRDEDLERIFEPFVQVDGGTEREHGGGRPRPHPGQAVVRAARRACRGDERARSGHDLRPLRADVAGGRRSGCAGLADDRARVSTNVGLASSRGVRMLAG